jgi:hypothetical protein
MKPRPKSNSGTEWGKRKGLHQVSVYLPPDVLTLARREAERRGVGVGKAVADAAARQLRRN